MNESVLAPCAMPKPLPFSVTKVPTGPMLGFRVVINGATVKVTSELLVPPAVTTETGPLAAPTGTTALMLVVDQDFVIAETPLKNTVLEPWLVPKPVPVKVTVSPAKPLDGEIELMWGTGGTEGPLSVAA